MTPLENELQLLKIQVVKMWNLVELQLEKAHEAMLKFDKDLAREVTVKEKRANGYEIKIDRDCEDIFAIYTPVAIDLRFLLAVLKINANLERTADIADGIARYVIDLKEPFKEDLLAATQLVNMYDKALEMLEDARAAFENEDTELARSIFKKDEIVDEFNLKAVEVITQYLKTNPDYVHQGLFVLSIIRKLERVGDQAKNLAEEIIFYIEAKVLKHTAK
jgi:phosphate transport system protein